MTAGELRKAISHIPDDAQIECSTRYSSRRETDFESIWFGIVAVEKSPVFPELPPEDQHFLIFLTDQPTMC